MPGSRSVACFIATMITFYNCNSSVFGFLWSHFVSLKLFTENIVLHQPLRWDRLSSCANCTFPLALCCSSCVLDLTRVLFSQSVLEGQEDGASSQLCPLLLQSRTEVCTLPPVVFGRNTFGYVRQRDDIFKSLVEVERSSKGHEICSNNRRLEG